MNSRLQASQVKHKKLKKEWVHSASSGNSNFRKQHKKTLIEIFQVIGFIVFLIGCLYQSGAFFEIFFQYPTSVEMNVIQTQVLAFPAVTICNGNRVRFPLWCEIDPKVCGPSSGESRVNFIARLEKAYKSLNKSMRIQLGHQKDVFIRVCQFEEESCTENVAWFFDYEYTNCFTVNAQWSTHNNTALEATMFRPRTGRSSELSLLLDIEPAEYSPFTSVQRARMTIHAPDIIPNPQYDAVSLQPGNIYSYGVQKNTVNVLAAPYQTNCRNYSDEIEKRTGSTLTQEGCMSECYATTHRKNCGCTVSRLALLYNMVSCHTEKEARCLEQQSEEIRTKCYSTCRMPCSKTTYAYISVDAFRLTRGSCDNEEESDNSTYQEDSNNLVCIRVYYASPEIEIFSHRPKYNGIEVFSVIGGYTGLWLGVSMLTVYIYAIKIIEYFICPRKK